jgi:hypothetical protein
MKSVEFSMKSTWEENKHTEKKVRKTSSKLTREAYLQAA